MNEGFGEAIPGHSVNRRTLKTEELLSSSPSQNQLPETHL